MATEIQGTLTTDGILILDEKPNVPAGRVRVTVRPTMIDEPRKPNAGMLQALADIADLTKDMNPKRDPRDFLREAREGAMYGFAHDD